MNEPKQQLRLLDEFGFEIGKPSPQLIKEEIIKEGRFEYGYAYSIFTIVASYLRL